jgi:lipid II:glycine glycyltransferase (peptidoglycan interpeptide bridge formation enzyme)
MLPDYRQSPKFQDLLAKDKFKIITRQGHVGYLRRLKFFPLAGMLILPRVADPTALQIADQTARKFLFLIVNVSPAAPLESPQAPVWESELNQRTYKPAPGGVAPSKTLLLDLTQPDADLLAQMHSKTRYNIRLAERRNVTTRVVDGLAILADERSLDMYYQVYQQNCQRIGMECESKAEIKTFIETFGEDFFIVYADLSSGEIGAVAAYIQAGQELVYQMNGSTEAGRKDFAPNLVVWAGIQEGKRRGCTILDFDGIFDERYPIGQEKWRGFSRFKSGFGGREVAFPGSFVKRYTFFRSY